MNWWSAVKKFMGPGGWSSDGDPVFLLGPRRSGKTIFLASLYLAREHMKVVWQSEATKTWKEETMRVFFEHIDPARTDYSVINQFKDDAQANFQRLASNPDDEDLLKRIMLDMAVTFKGDALASKRRVCMPDPSGELFVQPQLLDVAAYGAYRQALSSAIGYIVVVGAEAGMCQKAPGSQAAAVHKVFNRLTRHAGASDYINRPVSVVMMKMDQHMNCCLQSPRGMSGKDRTAFLRGEGLNSDRMADLFELLFLPINRGAIEDVVAEGRLRFFGVSAYGFNAAGQPACTPSANGEDFVPTREARPVNIAEPLRWALGVDS